MRWQGHQNEVARGPLRRDSDEPKFRLDCAYPIDLDGIAKGGKLEAGVGIEPAYTALQAAA